MKEDSNPALKPERSARDCRFAPSGLLATPLAPFASDLARRNRQTEDDQTRDDQTRDDQTRDDQTKDDQTRDDQTRDDQTKDEMP